jgi:predicted nucleotidyltransferase
MLETLLGSRLRARILAWMFSHSEQRFFVRQLQSLLDEDAANISRELARLASLGILTVTPEGRQKYYQADSRCPVFNDLKNLVVKTDGVAGPLEQALHPLAGRVRLAFVYGSIARGEATMTSDIDLMVVGDVGFGEVVKALETVQRRLGREINPTVYSPGEFAKKVRDSHPFLIRILEGQKIILIGDENELASLA